MDQLEHLIDTYQNLVFSICFKIAGDYFEAEDLTQETFLSVYTNLDSFDGCNEKAWICRIATNKSIDYVRKKVRNQIPTEDEFFLEVEDKDSNTENRYILQMEREKIREICNSLKPPYNRIAKDYFCEEKTISQISEETGTNRKTVQTQVYRAKAMIQKWYRKEQINDR